MRIRLICRFVLTLITSVSCNLASVQSQTPPVSSRPNVILILADDLGWSDLACYGADLHETPALDELARQGVRFTNAYAASICSPSRASLLTGKHYARLQMTIWREASKNPPLDKKLIPPACVSDLAYAETTLAEVMKAAQYQTALVGKWHLGDANYYPETQGFDTNIGGTHWGAPQTYFFPYRGMGRFAGEFRYVPHLEGGKEGEYLTDRLTDEALNVINQSHGRPFFLYLAHHAPHTPIEADETLTQHFQQKLKPEFHHQNAKYAAMVHSLDQSVGRIVKCLKEKQILDQTLIVFLSDNGGHIGEYGGQKVTSNAPLRSGKGALYEGGIRIPLIVCGPGIQQGSISHQPVYIADLFPTICELIGVKPDGVDHKSGDGQSLVPLLTSRNAKLDREALYFHYPHYYPTTTPVSAIRRRNWKLIDFHEDQHVELYDLDTDPEEKNDRSAGHSELTSTLKKDLSEWRTSVQAQMPTHNPNFKVNR